MRIAPYVIIAAALVAIAVRIRRRGRARPQGLPILRWAKRALPRGRNPLGDAGLVAAREVRERVRGRFFKIVTLILLGVVAAAIVIPTIHTNSSRSLRIGVVGGLAAPLRHDVESAAKKQGTAVELTDEPSLAQARTALGDGRLDAVIDDHRTIIVKTPIGPSDTTANAEAVRAIASSLGIANALEAARLTPGQAAALAHAGPLPVTSIEAGTSHGAARSTSVIGVILVFIMLTQYNTWTLMGVMEEKSTRVVEVLLAAVRPLQLLAGKILGIGAVALAQAGLVVAFALIVATAVGSDLLKGTAPIVLVATLVWLVLGYAFYCWVYAAAGSMAERQDQVQSLALPLSIPIIVGYVVALSSAGSNNPSLLVKVFAYLPPTAPFAMPILVATGKATWWEFALSVVISIVCTVGIARLAAAVYRRAVLRTGGRVRLREVLGS